MIARLFPALRHRDFLVLWLASLSDGTASWGLIVARGWLVYDISNSSLWVGLTTFAALGPMLLMPPIAGFLADKVERRRLLHMVFALQLLHNLILAVLALSGGIQIWHIVLLSFFNGFARATQLPATQALLPNVVPRENLLNAVALNSATQLGTRLLGAAMIVPLMATTQASGAFFLCTGFYGLALLLSLAIRSSSKGKIAQEGGALSNFFAGLTYIYRHPTVMPLMVVVFLHCCLTMAFESLLPGLSRTRLSGGDGGFNYLMMAVGAGSLLGIMAVSPIQSLQTRGRVLLVTGLLSGLSPIALAASTSMAPALLSIAAMGASQAAFMALATAVVQWEAPDAIRGRVMSVYLWHIGGVMAGFNLLNGALADVWGAPWFLLAPGILFAGVIGVSLFRLSMRRLYVQGVVQSAPAT